MAQIVSYGAGINSTAMVCEMVRRGERMDAIVFADTGGERPSTYEHLNFFSAWLEAHGYPPVLTVKNTAKVGAYIAETLEQECLMRRQLPGIAYGFGSCSDKWKQQPFKTWLKTTGLTDVTVCIGFDADETYRAQRGETKYAKRFPLIEWGMGREECVATILAAGIKPPGKSACFFCPSSTKREILELSEELRLRALAIEAAADLTTLRGLGRRFSWAELIDADERQGKLFDGDPVTVPCGCYDG